MKTTGAPARLELEVERLGESDWHEGSRSGDIVFVNLSVRDAEGLVVPNAKVSVVFSVEGPGEIVATDNGDETDFDDFRKPRRRTFNGWAQVVVRTLPGENGELKVRAESAGLAAALAAVNVKM